MVATLLFLFLEEASRYFVEPAVRDLVGTVHDTAQYEFLHDRLLAAGGGDAMGCGGSERQVR